MALGPARLQRQHPVEHRGAGERADNVIIRPGPKRAAAILGIVAFQHHGYMGIGGAGIGTQPAAHLQPREIVHHPVDEGPHRPLDQPARAFRPQPVEGEAALIMDEIIEAFAEFAGQEDIDDVHVCPAWLRGWLGRGV